MAKHNRRMRLVGPLILLGALSGGARASNVAYPYIDTISLTNGTDVTSDGTTLKMTATSTTVVGASSSTPILPNATFSLTAAYSAALTAGDTTPNAYDFTGTLSINNGTNLLTASIADLQLVSVSGGSLDFAIAAGNLLYTGGSLAGTLGAGAMTGSFVVTSFTPNGNNVANLSDAFSGSDLTTKVGAVVPLPASLPLLLTALGFLAATPRQPRRPPAGSAAACV